MKQIIRNRNEVMHGAAPKCMKVLRTFKPDHAAYYVDAYYGSTLIPALSKRFGVAEEQIIESYGGEDFLRTAFDWLRPETDSVLVHQYHYGYYKTYLDFKGIKTHQFKMREEQESFVFDVDDCIAQYGQHKPKIVIITSPNNPTGNVINADDFEHIMKTVKPETLVILDEAYWGFDQDYDEQSFLRLLERYPNLAILRSFSKYFALAGLRMGFALCGKNVKTMLHYQHPYLGMSRLLEEVAVAALDSTPYYRKIAKEVMKERARLIKEIKALKHFKPYNSKANLVFMKADEHVTQALEKALTKLPVLTIKKSYGNYWRITVGLPKVNTQLIKTLQSIDRA